MGKFNLFKTKRNTMSYLWSDLYSPYTYSRYYDWPSTYGGWGLGSSYWRYSSAYLPSSYYGYGGYGGYGSYYGGYGGLYGGYSGLYGSYSGLYGGYGYPYTSYRYSSAYWPSSRYYGSYYPYSSHYGISAYWW